MSTLFWPGDERAGDLFSDAGLLAAMVDVETAWLGVLAGSHPALGTANRRLAELVGPDDLARIATEAEAGGNPVIRLVSLLRERMLERGDTAGSQLLHRGLTSQDVLDTALVLQARDTHFSLTRDLRHQVTALAAVAGRHRSTAVTGRTLTQPAVPITFGAKVAGWLDGVLDAAEDLDRLGFPVQVGGAAGTLSGVRLVSGGDGTAAIGLARRLAAVLELDHRAPWHTDRAPVTRIGEAFARCTAAWGRIANDVLTLSRPEIGELTESDGGGSSAMPQKANPVLAVLIRRAALTAPAHLSLLHLAAADTGDERPAGAWHVEWQALHLLARHTLTAASQTVVLLDGLRVHTDRMTANLARAVGVDAEARSLGDLVGEIPVWAGAGEELVDAAVDRAREWLGER